MRSSGHLFSLVILMTALGQAPALADEPGNPAPRGLSAVMKEMFGAYGMVKKQSANPEHNAASANLMQGFRAQVVEGLALVPSKVLKLPEAEQRLPRLGYQRIMAQLYAEGARLEELLLGGDQNRIKAQLTAMDLIMKEGHTLFREPR